MEIRLANHAYKRLKQPRQKGIALSDVHIASKNFMPNSKIKEMRFRSKAKSGRYFELVIADKEKYRKVITIIGL